MAAGRGVKARVPARLLGGRALGCGKVKAFPLMGAESGGPRELLPGGLFSVAGMGKPEKPGVVGPMSKGRGPHPQRLQPTPSSPFSRPKCSLLR